MIKLVACDLFVTLNHFLQPARIREVLELVYTNKGQLDDGRCRRWVYFLPKTIFLI